MTLSIHVHRYAQRAWCAACYQSMSGDDQAQIDPTDRSDHPWAVACDDCGRSLAAPHAVDRIDDRGNIRAHYTADDRLTLCGIEIGYRQRAAGNAMCKRCESSRARSVSR